MGESEEDMQKKDEARKKREEEKKKWEQQRQKIIDENPPKEFERPSAYKIRIDRLLQMRKDEARREALREAHAKKPTRKKNPSSQIVLPKSDLGQPLIDRPKRRR